METAFELADFAARMVEAKFRREHPDATEEQVRAAVGVWWSERPGASDTDWSDATDAVDLIHERGYDRGRDLQASLITLREHGAY